MANTPLKFFKGASAPTNPSNGMIWFDTKEKVVKVYNGSWEEFCGDIQVKNVAFKDSKLTITPRSGEPVVLDFSDVASATETGANFAALKKRLDDIDGTNGALNELTKADSDINDRIDGVVALVGELPTDATQDNVVDYFEAKIEAIDTTSAAEGVAGELAKEVERATKKEGELAKSIEDNAKAASDALAEAVGKYAAEGVDASGLRKEIAERDAQVLVDAKAYVDGIVGDDNSGLVKRIKTLEDIDHDQLASDAAAAAVATVLDDAPEAFDTLKEIADWIQKDAANENGFDAAARIVALEGAVDELEKIDHAGLINTAIAELDGGYTATTNAEGKVAVVTGITQTDGKVVSGAQTEVYTTAKIDALFSDALGDNGSVATQITNALDALDLAISPAVTVEKNGVSVIATVTQNNGQVAASAVEVEKAGAAKAAEDAAKLYVDGRFTNEVTGKFDVTGAAATAKAEVIGDDQDAASDLTIYGVRAYADAAVAGKNVTASGDTYVSASASENHVTVTTNIDAIREEIFSWAEFND